MTIKLVPSELPSHEQEQFKIYRNINLLPSHRIVLQYQQHYVPVSREKAFIKVSDEIVLQYLIGFCMVAEYPQADCFPNGTKDMVEKIKMVSGESIQSVMERIELFSKEYKLVKQMKNCPDGSQKLLKIVERDLLSSVNKLDVQLSLQTGCAVTPWLKRSSPAPKFHLVVIKYDKYFMLGIYELPPTVSSSSFNFIKFTPILLIMLMLMLMLIFTESPKKSPTRGIFKLQSFQ